jgi:tetratricopeptide (TPR) repeat protein
MNEVRAQDDIMLTWLAEVLGSKSQLDEVAMNLATSIYEEHCKTDIGELLDRAVEFAQKSLHHTPSDSPCAASRWNDLGLMLDRRYSRSGEMADLQEAIAAARQAVNSTPNEHVHRPGRLNNLSNKLEKRYKQTSEITDLEEAVETARQVVTSAPVTDPDQPTYLNNLGNKLRLRYQKLGAMKDLEEAIAVVARAADFTLCSISDRTAYLNNLANMLGLRYEQVGRMADLEQAIETARQAVDLTPVNHPYRLLCLNNLGVKLDRKYSLTGQMADLEEAIETKRQAIDLTPSDHPDRAGYLNNLSNKLIRRYEQTAEMADLEEAVTTAHQAVDLTPADHTDRAMYLNNLGIKIDRRYERTGEMANLEEAIKIARQAIDLSMADELEKSTRLSSLGYKLKSRYERTGEMADLEEAISLVRRAVDFTPANHVNRVRALSDLGTNLGLRYERTGEMADLEEAVTVARQAREFLPVDYPGRATCLSNLSSQLERRYSRTGKMTDLEEAIAVMRQALDSMAASPVDRPRALNNMGVMLQTRYERTGEMTDLEEAIKTVLQAVDSTPSDHPDRAGYLNNLGNSLEKRYERTGEMVDLEGAVGAAQQAAQLTPADHADRAVYLNNLGNKLVRRYEQTQELCHLQNAATAFTLAWRALASVPFHRIASSRRAIKIFHRLGQNYLAALIAEQVIDVLPTINPRFLNRSDRQYILSRYSGIAADACAVLLKTRSTGTALQCLEKGRAVILGQLIDDRTDITALRSEYSELASQFDILRNEVNNPANTSLVAHRHRLAAVELDKCIKNIQQLPGHTHFMSGLSEDEMRACATDGPIVVVNVSALGSDAIIVSPDSIKSLALPNLSAEVAETWISRDWHSRDRPKRGENNKKYIEYLGWLWHVCVKPILDAVSPRENGPDGQLPRVWWVGSGLASSMPFHAAGVYSSWPGENALGRVVSSYAPSIKALAYSRTRRRHERAIQPKVLIATMPVTPDLKSLPGAGVERESVAQVLGTSAAVEDIEQPTSEVVARRLTQCSIAHFACHGRSDSVDPSNSGLIFARRDENGDIVQDTLTVHKVSEINLQNARLAYLSACSTAENKSTRLADEAIHVATGFQVAGFPHVVGCLWPSVDQVCAEIAHSFYTLLTQDGSIDLGNRAIAVALHQSVLAVAARDWKRPLNWAQFVHYGA